MTRLATTSSDKFAALTYESLLAYQEILLTQSAQQFDNVYPYWAVAESLTGDSSRWRSLPVLYQGEGTLGPRMATICEQLIARHGAYGITGADCPQFQYSLLGDVRDYLLDLPTRTENKVSAGSKRAVVCPSVDGGFVFFAANFAFVEPWRRLTYSHDSTCEQLMQELTGIETWVMDTMVDIDEYKDIALALEQARQYEQIQALKLLEKILHET